MSYGRLRTFGRAYTHRSFVQLISRFNVYVFVDYFRDACGCTLRKLVPSRDPTAENELGCDAAIVLQYCMLSVIVRPRGSKELVFGCLNIRSLHSRLDDFL
jgi:hypothetical protein